MDTLWRDIRQALRGLARSPGFALATLISLGIGIGANTTVFAWLDSIVRHPFPGIPGGHELVALNVADGDGSVDGMPPIAYPVLEEWRTRMSSFRKIGAHAQARANLRVAGTDDAAPIWIEITSASFFDTVGISAGRGRLFDGSDEAAGAAVVVVSHALWQRRFGGAPDTVGRSVLLNGMPFTIIGIAPPRFTGVVMGLAFEAWVPIWQQPAVMPGTDWMRDRQARRLQAVARLREGVTLAEANRELHAVARAVSKSFGETPVTSAGARWISDTQLGSLMGPLGAAMLAVTALLLVSACANVAGLLLARSLGRQRQTAIQIAVGASRRRLLQQALVEAVILAAMGGALGLLVAQLTKGALLTLVPRVALPVSLEIDLSGRVGLFAAIVSTIAVLLFAIVPAVRGSQLAVVDVLKSSSAGGGIRRSRLRQGLVVVQVTLSLIALVIAGLFLRSVAVAARVPLGFGNPAQVLLVSTDLSFTRLDGDPLVTVGTDALERVRHLPGVKQAAFASYVPLGFGGPARVNTNIDGYAPRSDESMLIARASVTDDYFETMEIPIVEGRGVTSSDRRNGLRAVVINQAFAARYWPGQTSIGRRINQGDGWATVVGVAKDSAIDSVADPPAPLVYHAWAQTRPTTLTLHVRAASAPLSLVEPVRRQLAATHPDVPALDPGTLADRMQAAMFVQNVGGTVFTGFGLIALAISTVGLAGVAAQFVAAGGRDLAVLVALGATPGGVMRAVITPPLRLTLVGIGFGALLSTVAAILIRSQLVGPARLDVASIAGASGLVVVTSLLSCLWPMWRAVRLDPVSALKAQ
jgi:predicted permease